MSESSSVDRADCLQCRNYRGGGVCYELNQPLRIARAQAGGCGPKGYLYEGHEVQDKGQIPDGMILLLLVCCLVSVLLVAAHVMGVLP